MHRIFPFAAPNHVLRPWESRPDRPVGVTLGEAAGMIEMQMRGKHDVDRVGRDAGSRQRVRQAELALETGRCPSASPSSCRPHPRRSAWFARRAPAGTAWPCGSGSARLAALSSPRTSLEPRRTSRRHRDRRSRPTPSRFRCLQAEWFSAAPAPARASSSGLRATCFSSTSTPCALDG